MTRPPTLAEHLLTPIEPWRLGLIGRHLASVRRHAVTLQLRYPNHDVEPMACQALYLAALTFAPGDGTFGLWLNWKMRGAMSGFRRQDCRRMARGIRIQRLGDGDVDARYYYSKGD